MWVLWTARSEYGSESVRQWAQLTAHLHVKVALTFSTWLWSPYHSWELIYKTNKKICSKWHQKKQQLPVMAVKRKRSNLKEGRSLDSFINAYGEPLRIWRSLRIFISTWLHCTEGILSSITIHKCLQMCPKWKWRVNCIFNTPIAMLFSL